MRTVLTALLMLLPVAAVHATALPDAGWDAVRCGKLTVSSARTSGAPGAQRVEGFEAQLANPAHPGANAHLTATSVQIDGPPSLDGLPVLFAGGLLVALEHDRPQGCDFEHAFRRSAETAASLPQGAQADQRWTGLRARTDDSDVQAATLHLHASNGAGGITHIVEDATGLSSAGNDAAATPIARASIRVSMPHAQLAALAAGAPPGPDDVVTVDELRLSSTDTHLDAHGTVSPGSRSGHLIVHALNMEGIKDALPAGDRNRVGAMLLVMRLGAKQQPDGSLSWDVVWDGDSVTVNGISLPMHL